MDLTETRRLVIISIFSDDMLYEQMVLKGASALELVHEITARGSIDVDFSLERNFKNVADIERRIHRALADRFDSRNYRVFDYSFQSIPPDHENPWGGYRAEFKVIAKEKVESFHTRYSEHQRILEQMQREAAVIGPVQKRVFHIDISKNEFCTGNVEAEIDDYAVRVYTPEMIAIEKFRAICQQMPEYAQRTNKTPRARDFYDIHAIVESRGLDLATEENIELFRNIFAAKDVPLRLLSRVEAEREFHRPDWPAVTTAVAGELHPFDFYFDFALKLVVRLQALGVVDSPG